nr:MAG TPA: hypothetical protein [Caudoviricetes sp.]
MILPCLVDNPTLLSSVDRLSAIPGCIAHTIAAIEIHHILSCIHIANSNG